MSVIVINAIEVPRGQERELEARFAARKHSVDQAPGFEGFELLRPLGDGTRYFVYTRWASRADFENWRAARTPRTETIVTGMEVLEFEVVEL